MSGYRAARHAPSRHAATGPGRQLRPQLVRAAVLPTLAAGLSGAAAVIFTLQLGGGEGTRDPRLWPVLTGCGLLAVGALAAALLGGQRAAKAVRERCESLRRSSLRGRQELRAVADRLERGETPPRPVRGGPSGPPAGTDPAGVDEFWLLAQELRGAREQAHHVLVRLAGQAAPSDSDRKVEVFVNLARRLQSLVHREISLLDGLEDTVEDPDLLKELFHVDHLATRIRRHAENLAVLGGAASRRQWTRPIDLSEVLRSSVAEVEQYTRVNVVPPAGGTVRGHAVADVVHLLAELIENATVFSAPDTDVVVRAERVTSGIAVEVEDRGLGMPAEEQHRMNALLGDPDQVNVRHLLADGRIGLFVVSALARRHGVAVELKSNIYGGVRAVLVLPHELLGAQPPGAADAQGGSTATSWGTGVGAAMPPLEPVRVPPAPRRPEPAGAGPTVPSWAEPVPRPRTEPAAEPLAKPVAEPVPYAVSDPDPGPEPDVAPGSDAGPALDAGSGTGAALGAGAPTGAGPALDGPGPGVALGTGSAPGVALGAGPHTGAGPALDGGPGTAAALGAGFDGGTGFAAAAGLVPAAVTVPAARVDPDRPTLPRRRAQEHLVPELREAPAPRPAPEAEPPVHDPGLMAAFRRGFERAGSEPPP
ncbi:ATP-binding protein [Streptomyces sp. NPDC046161]|uniref:sensor histidine kinase n=1 Tax=Streptomyces sp. NPDC046161 TaxID=3155132 RepID=UPI0033E7AB72